MVKLADLWFRGCDRKSLVVQNNSPGADESKGMPSDRNQCPRKSLNSECSFVLVWSLLSSGYAMLSNFLCLL